MPLNKVLLLVTDEVPRQDLEQQLQPRYDLASVATLAAAQHKLAKEDFDLIIADVELLQGTETEWLDQLQARPSGPLLVVISAFGSVESAAALLNQGAFAYFLKPFSSHQLNAVLKKAEAHAHLLKVNAWFSRRFLPGPNSELLGQSPAMEQLRTLIRKVAPTQATVLIQGESGVGKELVARALFAQSPRAGATFIKVDCAALPETLLERELFGPGHAAPRSSTSTGEGCFQLADGGTILLDEIGLISAPAQAKLLRFLQKQEIEGTNRKHPLHIDTRIIATTNRCLEEQVKRGEFREDLFLALGIVPITVPPLRDHLEDVPLLAEHFRKRFSRQRGVDTLAIPASCLNALRSYSWPGNVRELQNAVERAVIFSAEGGAWQPEHFGFPAQQGDAAGTAPSAETGEADSLNAIEKKHIFTVLEKCKGNRTHAAARLGISIRTLRNKLRGYKGEDTEQPSVADNQ
jgi:DNA-binding NtrC family response regulator